MPTKAQRSMRCSNCKSKKFVQHEYTELRTPVDVKRHGSGIAVEAIGTPVLAGTVRVLNVRCANCSTPLRGATSEPVAVDYLKSLEASQ